jgi:hypothetical protein
VKAAFRSLKTDPGLCPVYHHTEDRCTAHLYISVHTYHLLNTIELLLAHNGEHKRWATVRDEFSTHKRTAVIMTDSDGGIHHIRVSPVQNPTRREIYDILSIKDTSGKVHLVL